MRASIGLLVISMGCADPCAADTGCVTVIDATVIVTKTVAVFTARARFDSGSGTREVHGVSFSADGVQDLDPQIGPSCELNPHESCEGVWTGAVAHFEPICLAVVSTQNQIPERPTSQSQRWQTASGSYV